MFSWYKKIVDIEMGCIPSVNIPRLLRIKHGWETLHGKNSNGDFPWPCLMTKVYQFSFTATPKKVPKSHSHRYRYRDRKIDR
jgi:hypothetical protein